MGVPKPSNHIQIKVKMQNPNQEPPASTKSPNQELRNMDVLCIFQSKIESQNSEYWCLKDQWPYQNQDQDAKPQSGTSSPKQSPKSGLKGHKYSLHFQNHFRQLKFKRLVYQRPLAMNFEPWRILSFSEKSKSGSNSNLTAKLLWANPSWVNLASYNN